MSVSKQIALQMGFPKKRTPTEIVILVNYGTGAGLRINNEALSLCEYDE